MTAQRSRPSGAAGAATASTEDDTKLNASVAPPTDIRVYRACRATWAHLRARGLTSEAVLAELHRILREAAP